MKCRFFFKIMLAGFGAAALTSFIINIWMIQAAEGYVYTDIASLPRQTAVLVPGSMIHGNRLSPVLRDRVEAGISLMENGKGGKLLLSGDHGQIHYDEVNAMRLYVLDNAPVIQAENIFMDHAGFSTWDSLYRARDVFEVKDLVIVTQEFHIARAICMARSLGLDAIGFSLRQEHFPEHSIRRWEFREYFARIKAFIFMVIKPKPKYLGEVIPITGDGRESWD